MDLKLQGKTALVTGSTAGIGFAAALGLARERARVIVNGRTQERVSAAIAQIESLVPGARAEGVAADLSTAAGAQRIVEAFPDSRQRDERLGGESRRLRSPQHRVSEEWPQVTLTCGYWAASARSKAPASERR